MLSAPATATSASGQDQHTASQRQPQAGDTVTAGTVGSGTREGSGEAPRVTCQMRGAGVLAMRGYFGAEFVAGVLSSRSDGCVIFGWNPDSHDSSVLMWPRWARDGEFVGKEVADGLLALRHTDADVLRERAQLVARASAGPERREWFGALEEIAAYMEEIEGEEDFIVDGEEGED